jgi:hypothetical protein
MMEKNPTTINDHTMFVIKAHADLNLQGWDRMEMQPVSDDYKGLSVQQDGDMVRIFANSDLDVSIPMGAAVLIERVSGDANIRNLTGSLKIQRVGGDLAAQQIGVVDIQAVGGDCMVVSSTGPLAIQRVGGDFQGSQLSGPVRLESVGGDAILKVAGGAIHIRTGGDLDLCLEVTDSEEIRAQSNGDVLLGVPQNGDADLDLNSRGRDIRVEIGGNTEEIEKRFHHLVLGAGSQKISIEAGGDICVMDDPLELGNRFSGLDDLEDDLEGNWKNFDETRSEWTSNIGQEFSSRAEDLSDRINKHVEEAMRQADSRMQEAMKRLELRTRRLERHGGVPPVPPIPPIPPRRPGGEDPAAKKTGPSEEEKMLILKMLQEKKITVEEAEKLLEALER